MRPWRPSVEGFRVIQDYVGVRASVSEGVDSRPSKGNLRPWYRGSRHTDLELFEVDYSNELAGATEKPPVRTFGIRRYKCGIAGDEALLDGEDGLQQT